MKLKDQVALVTGASHGLGLAIARSLSAEGASVALLARSGERLERAAAELGASGRPAMAVPADVTRSDEVEHAVQQLIERWGRIDVVVLNAGTWKGAPIHETSERDWDFLLDLNLKGAFLTLKHTVPWFIGQRRGTLIGIDSLGGWMGQANAAAYAASKWGLRGLLESAAAELEPHRVRVSIVYPHNINSMGRDIPSGSDERDAYLEPPDVASLVTWICSAPEHVSVGHATIWPIRPGFRKT